MSKYFLPLIIAVFFLSFFRLGVVPLFDVDEAVFSTATVEMVQTGDWITPTYNGENRYDKPILFYWLMALSYKVFGINNFAARVPSALAAGCLAVALFLFVRHSHGEKRAFHAVMSFMLSIYFLVYSHAAVTDMALTLFISISLFCFYLYSNNRDGANFSEKPPHKIGAVPVVYYLYGFYAFSALAFLTKGLIGIVFPFGIALIYLYAIEGIAGVKKIITLKGILIFLLLSVPWYAAQISINGQEFIDQFFIKHHFKRFAGVISGHNGPVYYYIPALLIGLFPWVAFLPSGFREVFKRKDRLNLFAFIWAAFVVVFFSLASTKLPNYILPAIPAAVIIIASGMDCSEKTWNRFAYSFMALLAALLCAGLVIAGQYMIKDGIPENGWLVIAAAVMAAVALAAFYALIVNRTPHPVLYGLMGLFIMVLLVKALPAAGAYLQGALYRYSIYAKETLPPNELIVEYGINKPSVVFYSGHKIVHAGSGSELKTVVDAKRHALIIGKTKDRKEIEALGLHVLEMDATYALFEKK
ncbi:MAG: glycosyltransferase family 39 protein [Dissulfurispiraceae bacterium]|jgi:4-amino-4-deoxy-L-arabinose transferase-like glycosyltransferase